MKRMMTSLVLGLAVVAMTGCNVGQLLSGGDDPVRVLATLALNSGGSAVATLGGPGFQTGGDDTGIGLPPQDGGPTKPVQRPTFCTATSRCE